MTAKKFTPGPWDAVCDAPGAKVRMALVVTSASVSKAIDATGSGKNYAEDCANACLIAAAPDLLEALQSLLDEQNGAPLIQREKQWQAACDAAQAAIAKATQAA